ncbi:hypothetical protein [Azospirillum cavernae]|uniref:hypothetical protein n=1 Tax=Azospirillum cavernae TaxID=2320860 RepID=UPI0011C346F9|nr:hypothetical protein [Azospirillum cavernae]
MTNNEGGTYDANPRTKSLRPEIDLTDPQIDLVRRMRREGTSPDQIAALTGFPIDEITKALYNLRTSVNNPTRMTINADIETYNFVISHQRNDETIGETLRRLLIGE